MIRDTRRSHSILRRKMLISTSRQPGGRRKVGGHSISLKSTRSGSTALSPASSMT